MKYTQTSVNPKREFSLGENHISIKQTPTLRNHREWNFEYSALTTTISTALVRRESFSFHLFYAGCALLMAVIFYFTDREPVLLAWGIISVCIVAFIVTLTMAYIVRKRIPYFLFHNHEGLVLFEIGGISNEFDVFILELKKRISEAQSKRHENT